MRADDTSIYDSDDCVTDSTLSFVRPQTLRWTFSVLILLKTKTSPYEEI